MINNIKDRLATVTAYLSALNQSKAVHDDIGYSAFVLSLLPIPGVSQAAQVVQRFADNKSLQLQFNEVWQEIVKVNASITDVAVLEARVEAIANTVRHNTALMEKMAAAVEALKHDLATVGSTWAMVTTGNSYQELIDSVIDATQVKISAAGGSENVLDRVTVKAQHTELMSDGGSRNSVRNANFQGISGAVGMSNIVTKGPVSVSESSIGFGLGGMIGFSAPPTGTCSICNKSFPIYNTNIPGMSCPHCNAYLQMRR